MPTHSTSLLAFLLPNHAGVHLHDIPFGRSKSGNANWRNSYRGPDGIPPSQLLSPLGTKVALAGVTAPYLKTTCYAALNDAKQHGLRSFFWVVHEKLAAQLQHGVSVEQDSTYEAAVVMRKCVLSCAQLGCILVTIYHMLLDGPAQLQQQQQQQQRPGACGGGAAAAAAGGGDGGGVQHAAAGMQQQQQHKAGIGGAAASAAAAAAAAASAAAAGGGGGDAGGTQHPAAGMQQQQQREGMLSCKLSYDAQGEGIGALLPAHHAQESAAGFAINAQQQEQQQQPPAHLPATALLPQERAAAFLALDAVAASVAAAAAAGDLSGDVASLAAARQAAGRPLPLVPPLVAPGVQEGQGQAEQELLLLDAASLRVLVRRLCPALDTLLALTPSMEGKTLVRLLKGWSAYHHDPDPPPSRHRCPICRTCRKGPWATPFPQFTQVYAHAPLQETQ